MSDAHNEHESAIKTPKQLIVAVIAAFVVPIIIIVLLVQYVTSDKLIGAGSVADNADKTAAENATVARIQPLAEAGFVFKDVNAPKVLLGGEAVYKATCAVCHASGVAGAPKVGDAAAWSARIAAGYDTVLKHAVEGLRAMPAKGGNADLDSVEVARAVVFMANQSGASFKEPEVKAAAPAASAPAEAAPAASASAAASAPVAASASAAASAPAAAPAKLAADAGKKLYEASCQACHATGLMNAPKFGDKAAWAERVKQGMPALYANAIKGKGTMPAKGGATASDDEVKAAVDYMTAAAK